MGQIARRCARLVCSPRPRPQRTPSMVHALRRRPNTPRHYPLMRIADVARMHAYALLRILLTVVAPTNVAFVIHVGDAPNAESVRLRTARTGQVAARRSPHYGQPGLTTCRSGPHTDRRDVIDRECLAGAAELLG